MSHCYYGAHMVVREYHMSNKCPRILRPNSGFRNNKSIMIVAYENLADAIMDGHVRMCPVCSAGKIYNVKVNEHQRQVWLSDRDHKVLTAIGKCLENGTAIMPKTVAQFMGVDRIVTVKSFNLLQKMCLITRGHQSKAYGLRGLTPIGLAVYEMSKYNEAKKTSFAPPVDPYKKM